MDFQALFDQEFLTDISKDVKYEVQMFVKTLGEQITNNNTRSYNTTFKDQNFYFTSGFYNGANEFNLTEADAIEVYNTGQVINETTILREYNGYEVGIEYNTDFYSGKPLITSIWKREI